MRVSFMINSNTTSIPLSSHIPFTKMKISKFRMIPDNITTNAILVQIALLDHHYYVSQNNRVSYTFLIPFTNNNNMITYTNDLTDTWDMINHNIPINKLDIRICNENGQLLTFNNSNIIMEILFE